MKTLLITAFLIIFITSPVFSQFEFIKRKAKEKMEKAVEKKMEESENSEEEGQNEESEENADKKEGIQKESSKTTAFESYSKFDFIPGEKVIFFEDFSQDAIGDFPMNWNTNGSGEIVNTNIYPGNWLQVKPNSYASVWTDKLLDLPENYTLEFDVIPLSTTEDDSGNMSGYEVRIYKAINLNSIDGGSVPGESGFAYDVEYYGRSNYRAYWHGTEDNYLDISGKFDEEKYHQKANRKYHISIWVQKTRIRLYQDDKKLFDLPKAISLDKKYDRFRIDDGSILISNIRIAVGAPDMRSKLITEGKLVSYGIYFDVNKDIVKPESYGTLKEIAKVLTDNPDVKVKVIGHTDSDGKDDANLELSKKRGESVKNELIKTFGIDASRLEFDGKGESEPIGPNDTPANKALNRRVEFIKI